jgi:hypothetical protein
MARADPLACDYVGGKSLLTQRRAQVTNGRVNGVLNVVFKMRVTMGFARRPNIFMMHQMER